MAKISTIPEAVRYATVKQFAASQNVFSESSLRWLIFNKDTNQFAAAFKKIGRKVLIDIPTFYGIVEQQAK